MRNIVCGPLGYDVVYVGRQVPNTWCNNQGTPMRISCPDFDPIYYFSTAAGYVVITMHRLRGFQFGEQMLSIVNTLPCLTTSKANLPFTCSEVLYIKRSALNQPALRVTKLVNA
jgi:hypothetical protein